VLTYSKKNNIPNPLVKEKGIAGYAWVEGFLLVIPWLHPAKHKI